MDLINLIMDSRQIRESSAKTYIVNLKKLNKALDNTKLKDFEFTKQFDNITKIINKEPKMTNKKNLLTAVIVALGTFEPKENALINKYNVVLKKLTVEYLNFLKTQTKTETQKENWVTYEELVAFSNELKETVTAHGLLKKKVLSKSEFNLMQEYIILMTYLEFPIRNNFANMKVLTKQAYMATVDKMNHNYLVTDGTKKYFYINVYKNSDSLGSKIFRLSTKLNKLVSKWLKHNTTGYYLVKVNKTPITSNGITQFLNKMFFKQFQKKISSSMLRHIIISHKCRRDKTISQKDDESENIYMHSSFVNQLYRKIK